MSDPIVIVSAARTPIGGLLGDFSALAGHQLGAVQVENRCVVSERPPSVPLDHEPVGEFGEPGRIDYVGART